MSVEASDPYFNNTWIMCQAMIGGKPKATPFFNLRMCDTCQCDVNRCIIMS